MNFKIWINLASNNLPAAKDFYQKIGFEMNTMHEAPHMVSMFVGLNRIVINLFEVKLMEQFMGNHPITITQKSNEVLFSISAESPAEVDEWAKKVRVAGGVLYSEPMLVDGWMYGFGFMDPDGHRFNLLYMDMSKMPLN
jgi:predicted lactoylglutathione lyase